MISQYGINTHHVEEMRCVKIREKIHRIDVHPFLVLRIGLLHFFQDWNNVFQLLKFRRTNLFVKLIVQFDGIAVGIRRSIQRIFPNAKR